MRLYLSSLGIVSGLGTDREQTLEALLAERSSLARPRHIASRHHPQLLVGEVGLSDAQMCQMLGLDTKIVSNRTTLLAMLAVKQCLEGAGALPPRLGLISGNTVGGMEKSELYYKEFLDPLQDTHTAYIDAHDCGSCTEKIADYFDVFSFITTLSTACSSAANAMAMGADLIRTGRLDAVVVGGTECLSKFHINGFMSLMILNKDACAPFDAQRKGINLGEGAAYLLLESEESLKRRGGQALAELTGYGNACDAYHQTASSPEGEGAFLAMSKALKMSGLKTSDIDYINAHGTGTANNDASEARAIVRVFGPTPPPVSSTKAFTGHTTSAAGTVEAVICLLAMQQGFIPANLNFKEQDADIGFAPVTQTRRHQNLRHVMNNSFGFGGNNSSLIFSKVEDGAHD